MSYLAILEDCGGDLYAILPARYICTEESLAAFAARIRAEDLEEAAKVCDAAGDEWDSDAVITEKNYAHACAAAIRNLSSARSTPSGVTGEESKSFLSVGRAPAAGLGE